MLNIWDWELLSDLDLENRLQNWIDKQWLKTAQIEGRYSSESEVQARHLEIFKSTNVIFHDIALLQQFWLVAVWVIRCRLFHTWYQDLNKDKQHWVHGRGRIYLLMNDQRKIDTYQCSKLYASWCAPADSAALEIHAGGEDDSVMLHFGCWLFSVWLAVENIIPRGWAEKISKYDHERTSGISFHHGCFWFSLWRDEYGYADYRGIHLCFDVVEFLFGRLKSSDRTLENAITWLHLPEGTYRLDARLYELTQRRSRSPFARKITKCELTPVIPIPIPGKGENDCDLDDDAIHALTVTVNSVDEAIDYLRNDVMRTRLRHGGEGWQPEGVAYSD